MADEAFLLLALLTAYAGISAHPMCLDYESPGNVWPEGEFELCHNFAYWGCCSKQRESEIHKRYKEVLKQMPDELGRKCSEIVKDLLCQECESFSAHMFGLEKRGVISSIPGLCADYCFDVFKNCSEAIGFLTNDTKLLNPIRERDVEAFCDAAKLPDDDYCFPVEYFQFYKTWKKRPCTHLCVEEIANKLYNPLAIKNAGDKTHRLFVVEQRGLIWVFLPNRSRIHPPFLNVSSEIAININGYDERGLLNIEFHPDHSTNGLFYVYYSVIRNSQMFVRISEMKVSSADRNRADPATERVILEIDEPYSNHHGGQLLFGNDGYLYIFTGDGGNSGDPHGNSQNKTSLLGKVLRVDVDSRGSRPYSIPPGNPFVSQENVSPEIFAYGLRNPWKCAFDLKGRLICGDAGQDLYEEIDLIVKGGNYGWNAYEGNSCFDEELCKTPEILETHIPPIHSYNTTFGGSIIGGNVYKGCENPKLQGKYIFGDFMSGRMGLLRETKSGKWKSRNICMSNNVCTRMGMAYKYPRYILTYGEDEAGEIYFGSTSNAKPAHRGGRIYKLSHAFSTTTTRECESSVIEPITLSPDSWLEEYVSTPDSEVRIRLIGAKRQDPVVSKGRVEIRPIGQRWSTICGKAWNLNSAHVVCRMMGFVKARKASLGKYGPGKGKVRFESINCQGDEDHIDECDHSGWEPIDCPHSEDASVWCESGRWN